MDDGQILDETDQVPTPQPSPRLKDPAKPVFAWRDAIEAVVVAVLFTLLIKQFAVEAYKVPTGSMAPTIIGQETGGDRILISRIPYSYRDPRRWEIAVFRYPLNHKISYIKRVVGLPNESMFILEGNIFTSERGGERESIRDLHARSALKIERKPSALQDVIFDRYPQIQETEDGRVEQASFLKDWLIPDPLFAATLEWSFDEGRVQIETESQTICRFRHPVTDLRKFVPIDDTNRGGRAIVNDLRLSMTVHVGSDPTGFLRMMIKDSFRQEQFQARIPLGDAAGSLTFGDRELSPIPDGILKAGKAHVVEFTHVDRLLEVRVDGQRVASAELVIQPAEAPAPRSGQVVGFGVEAGAVSLDHIMLQRDIHFLYGSLSRADIPDDHYFMLGDNSASSKDSREWVALEVQISEDGRVARGDTEAIIDPSDLTKRRDNPFKDSDEGPWKFVDHLGNIIELSGSLQVKSRRHAPLVARKLVIGRAFAVFLPWERAKLVR